MTEALTTLFEGKEIRVIEKENDVWMPCKDLGQALGLDRTTLYQHIKRNRDFFGETAIEGDILSHDGDDFWVNERGLYLLLARVSTGRVNATAKTAIIGFRKSIPALVQKYRKKEIVQAGHQVPILDAELTEAIHIAEICNKSPDLFLSAVLEKYGKTHLAAKLETAPVIVHGEAGWYNVSQLVAMCNDPLLNAERLNNYLQNNPRDPERRPFQYRDVNKLWRLTMLGREHGEEYLYTCPSKHPEIRIRWRESILFASGLRKPVAPDQVMLPQKATGCA